MPGRKHPEYGADSSRTEYARDVLGTLLRHPDANPLLVRITKLVAQGRSYREIAGEVDLSCGYVHRMYGRAKKMHREAHEISVQEQRERLLLKVNKQKNLKLLTKRSDAEDKAKKLKRRLRNLNRRHLMSGVSSRDLMIAEQQYERAERKAGRARREWELWRYHFQMKGYSSSMVTALDEADRACWLLSCACNQLGWSVGKRERSIGTLPRSSASLRTTAPEGRIVDLDPGSSLAAMKHAANASGVDAPPSRKKVFRALLLAGYLIGAPELEDDAWAVMEMCIFRARH